MYVNNAELPNDFKPFTLANFGLSYFDGTKVFRLAYVDSADNFLEVKYAKDGTTLPTIADRQKAGYLWLGWYDEDGNKYNSSKRVTADAVFYARWQVLEELFADFKWKETADGIQITGIKDPMTEHVVIPEGASSIGDKAFYSNPYLQSVEIPDSVVSIGDEAFFACLELKTVTIGKNVTSIGEDAFQGCGRLLEVYNKSDLDITAGDDENYGYVAMFAKTVYTAPYESKYVTNAQGFMYYIDGSDKILVDYVGNATQITLPNDFTDMCEFALCYKLTLNSITISSGTKKLGIGMFAGCMALTTVTIPSSVTEIDTGVFIQCSNLTTINYGGTMAQWRAITKGEYWNDTTGNYVIYCTDGSISK